MPSFRFVSIPLYIPINYNIPAGEFYWTLHIITWSASTGWTNDPTLKVTRHTA